MSVEVREAPGAECSAPTMISAEITSAALIIGWGNDLRGDDGVGCRVADHVERWHRGGVRVLQMAQLAPEAAPAIAATRRVIFVDACASGDEVTVTPLQPRASSGGAHDLDPRGLLALTEEVYGTCPPAWLVAIPAYRFDEPDSLSESTRRGMIASVCRLERLLLDL